MAKLDSGRGSERVSTLILQIRLLFLVPSLFVLGVGAVLMWQGVDRVKTTGVSIGHQIRAVALSNLELQINEFMKWPLLWCDTAVRDWEQGTLTTYFDPDTSSDNYTRVSQHLFYELDAQVRATRNAASLIYIASQEGLLFLYEWVEGSESLYSWERLSPNEKSLKINLRNRTSNAQLATTQEVLGYDPTQRDWYKQTTFYAPGQKNWTDVYTSVDGTMAVTAVAKLAYTGDADGWVGVAAADHTLDKLSLFLQESRPTPKSDLFLFERTGAIVASSYSIPSYQRVGSVVERYTITDTPIKPVRAAAFALLKQFGSFKDLPSSYHSTVVLDGVDYFIDTSDITDDYGLSWVACLLIPQSDIFASLSSERSNLLVLTIVLILAVVITSGLVTLCTIRPVQELVRRISYYQKDITQRAAVLDESKKRR